MLGQSAAVTQLPPQPTIALCAHLPLALSQVSAVHGSPSSQLTGSAPMHRPPAHVSVMVQALPSVHGSAAWVAVTTQPPVVGLHSSDVHGLPSSQTTGLETHTPVTHCSLIVHRLLSAHGPVTKVCWHFLLTQASVVQTLLSLQPPPPKPPPGPPPPGPPPQLPAQFGMLAYWQMPVDGLHASLVQSLLSLQVNSWPMQLPLVQASVIVQLLPSVQAAPSLPGVPTHLPSVASHASVVHGLPSSQATWPPAWHAPPKQVSPVVQPLPSLQTPPSAFLETHLPATHKSAVQALLSLQSVSTTHTPPHAGVKVEAHAAVLGSHVSVVQALPSSQLLGEPPTHRPDLQPSASVQALPSSHGTLSAPAGWTQLPVLGSHASVVHGLPSSQAMALPVQTPPKQLSVVQALPSSHATPSAGVSTHLPPTQLSVVQTLPSLHWASAVQAAPQVGMAACAQLPLVLSQVSSVHASPSSHVTVTPAQRPAAQASPLVHASPSEQASPVKAMCSHLPVVGLQASLVHGFLSSHSVLAPPAHLPVCRSQTSPSVHKLPSLQVWAAGVKTHLPVVASQVSSVHGLASSQASSDAPLQVPSLPQTSPVVQALPSSQAWSTLIVLLQTCALGSQLSKVHGFLSAQSESTTHFGVTITSASLPMSVSVARSLGSGTSTNSSGGTSPNCAWSGTKLSTAVASVTLPSAAPSSKPTSPWSVPLPLSTPEPLTVESSVQPASAPINSSEIARERSEEREQPDMDCLQRDSGAVPGTRMDLADAGGPSMNNSDSRPRTSKEVLCHCRPSAVQCCKIAGLTAISTRSRRCAHWPAGRRRTWHAPSPDP